MENLGTELNKRDWNQQRDLMINYIPILLDILLLVFIRQETWQEMREEWRVDMQIGVSGWTLTSTGHTDFQFSKFFS